MAIPERETPYTTNKTERNAYAREGSGTGWFVGIIVVLALLAIGYLVFSANSGPSTTSSSVNNTPAVQTPMTDPNATPTPQSTPAPMTAPSAAPMMTAPATEAPAATTPAAPATETAPATPAPAAPAAVPAQ